ncbi:MAG: hypothetical protein AABZ76_07525 [Pseudomonadota bacterium]|jgi:hypothetical protein|uniref:hypothetical protein n=1 Tax=Sphingobium yanoikuyae TaxID=13690 RepID=UPI0031113BC8
MIRLWNWNAPVRSAAVWICATIAIGEAAIVISQQSILIDHGECADPVNKIAMLKTCTYWTGREAKMITIGGMYETSTKPCAATIETKRLAGTASF